MGVDCSGLSRWVYNVVFGRDVLGGGNTNMQLQLLKRVTTPQPGDLVFFGRSARETTHVGIFVGNRRMINAAATGTDVRTDTVTSRSNLVGYYRF